MAHTAVAWHSCLICVVSGGRLRWRESYDTQLSRMQTFYNFTFDQVGALRHVVLVDHAVKVQRWREKWKSVSVDHQTPRCRLHRSLAGCMQDLSTRPEFATLFESAQYKKLATEICEGRNVFDPTQSGVLLQVRALLRSLVSSVSVVFVPYLLHC